MMRYHEYLSSADREAVLVLLNELALYIDPTYSAVFTDVHQKWLILRNDRGVVEMFEYLPEILGYIHGAVKPRDEQFMATFNECNGYVNEKYRR